MKILHSADWHLDAPLTQLSGSQAQLLKKHLLSIPGKIAALVHQHQCDLVLLSGDIFDGPYSRESLEAVQSALKDMAVPVFISPGNHDYCGGHSPWLREHWPENVHVFTKPRVESVAIPELDCRVYGAGYESMDCPGLLEGFRAECKERFAVCVLHADPNQTGSPYCPVTRGQIQESALDYLALGHIHQGGSFRVGQTLCAWPGCPMGKGYDETGTKGVLLVTLEDTAHAAFLSLDAPRFYDLEVAAGEDPAAAVAGVLPGSENDDFYRITLTGESAGVNLQELRKQFAQFRNLTLTDRTVPLLDIWKDAGQDTLEGIYFGLLRDAMDGAGQEDKDKILLAARISRQILEGREVALP